jgi:NADH-quinone oxidoreductase subunit N
MILACAAALSLILFNMPGDYSAYMNNMLVFDKFSISFSAVMISLTMLVFVVCRYYYRKYIEHLSDIYALFLFSLVGGILLVSYQNLVMLFLGIEILSIPLYILASSNRRNLMSNEAGLKYYLLGSFASCFLLLGITFIYGTTQSFDMNVIGAYVTANSNDLPGLFIIGCVLLIGAFIFKISAVPFHFWAPDVYHGSPTVITAFMATVVKTAAFGGFIRFISQTILLQTDIWQHAVSIIAILTMIVGNVLALYQTNLKRLLGYSGIANAGYVLIAVATLKEDSYSYVLYYMAGYSVATIIAFAIYSVIKEQTTIDSIDGLKGLYTNNRLITSTLAIAMLSLAGIPPLAGFVGKYAVFSNAVKGGNIWLVIIAVLTSLAGVYYYLRVMVNTLQTGNQVEKIVISSNYRLLLLFGIFLLLLLGVLPQLFFDIV